MSLAWLYPAGFAALATLLIPLLIHLARRDQQAPLEFAALRWLHADPRPRRRLRFDERLLLALRLLLLVLLALWLAQPVLHGAGDQRPYVAVVPGVAATATTRDTLPANARLHWLAIGFPALDPTSPPAADRQPISSLLRELDADLPAGTPLIVLAPPHLDGADAQRPRLSRPLDWRVVERTDADVARERVAALQSSPAPPRLRLVADAAHAADARFLEAAQRAWQPRPDAPEVLVRLQQGPLPTESLRHVAAGGTVLLGADVSAPAHVGFAPAWRDATGQPLAETGALGQGRLLRFTRRLQPGVMPELLEPTFPARLLDLLQPAPPAPTRVDSRAYAPRSDGRAYRTPPRELQSWLALAIALAFLLERLIATHAKRGRTA